MREAENISQLVKAAEAHIKSGNQRRAEEKLFQAFNIANKTQNTKATTKILDLLKEIGIIVTNLQSVELEPLKTEGFILDVGGGGEGIIGKLNGAQVIAIDVQEKELEETKNKALKVIMDASELKLLPNSFHLCTAFFSLMYIPKRKHLKVFQEVYRVLTENGRFAVWDVRIPASKRKFRTFIVPVRVKLPDEVVETGYGVKWQIQDLEYYKELAQQARFKVVGGWSNEEIFYLEMIKQG